MTLIDTGYVTRVKQDFSEFEKQIRIFQDYF